MSDSPREKRILDRIDELLAITFEGAQRSLDSPSELYMGTLGIASQLFGESSAQVAAVVQAKADIRGSNWDAWGKETRLVQECRGILRAIAADIKAGLVQNIRLESQVEVFADLIGLAKSALDAGAKDAAAVLAAAALEDALKKLALSHGISVEGQDMANVVNALKGRGAISVAQGSLLKGFVQIRNKALHAEWAKFDTADVKSLTTFTEQFLMMRLASSI